MANPSSRTRYRGRERERGKRLRPADKLAQLRSTVAALERSLPVMLTLDDTSDVDWTGFLDPAALSLRGRMRETLQLTQEAQELVAEQHRLKQLLHEHRVASRVLAGLVLRATPEEDWETSVDKWHTLARRHFKPWTQEQCHQELQAALRELNAFQWRTDKHTTGASFLGWRDSRRVDPARFQVQFDLYKTFHGQDLETFVARLWEVYTDPRLFREVIVGPSVLSSHTVLQRIGSSMVIIMASERSAALAVDVHVLLLVWLDKRERAASLLVRSINSPELMKAMDTPSDMWGSSLSRAQWKLHPGEAAPGFDFRLTGTIGAVDASFVNQWVSEVFVATLRTERRATSRRLLTTE